MPPIMIGSASVPVVQGPLAGQNQLVIPITTTPEEDGIVHVIFGTSYDHDPDGFAAFFNPVSCITSRGANYAVITDFLPLIGLQGGSKSPTVLWTTFSSPAPGWPIPPPDFFYPPEPYQYPSDSTRFSSWFLGSSMGSVKKGDSIYDLTAEDGDYVTLTTFHGNVQNNVEFTKFTGDSVFVSIIAFLVFFPGSDGVMGNTCNQRLQGSSGYERVYDNGDGWPDNGWPYRQDGGDDSPWGGGNPWALDWNVDYPPSEDADQPTIGFYPEERCSILTAHLRFDSEMELNNFIPFNGEVVGQVTGHNMTLVSTFITPVGPNTFLNPGGEWTNSPRAGGILGNYQLFKFTRSPFYYAGSEQAVMVQ